MRSVTVLLGLALLTAGCLGMGGDDSGTDADTASTSSPAPSPNASSTTNGSASGDHGHEPQPEKHWTNITGEISGVSTGAGGVNHVANETLGVPDTAQSLTIRVQTENGELNAGFLAPGCTNEPEYPPGIELQGPDCEESGTTTNDTSEKLTPNGGTVTFSTEQPKGGNWTVEMSKDNTGASTISYTVTAVYIDVHEPAADHHG